METAIVPAPTGVLDQAIPTIVPVETIPEPGIRELLRGLPRAADGLWAAWTMLAVCGVVSAGMASGFVALLIAEGFTTDLVTFLVWGPLFIATTATGVLILHRYPGHRVGWVLCLAGTVWVLANATWFYGTVGLEHLEGGLPGDVAILQAGFFYPFGLYLILVELLLIFPTGQLASPRWAIARWLGLLGALGASLSIGFGGLLAMNGEFGDVPNPWRVPGFAGEVMEVAGAGFFILVVMSIPAGISMIGRLRRSRGVERLQMRWIAWDTTILVIAYAIHVVGVSAFSQTGWFWIVFTGWGLVLNSFAIVVGLTILRYRLYDIDVVIHRSLLYATLVAIIAVLYLAMIVMIDVGAQRLNAGDPDPWLASLVVALAIALLAQPLRARVEEVLRRRLYGPPNGQREILGRLGLRLEAAIAPSDVLNDVTRSIMDVLRLPHAAVAMLMNGSLDLVAESGTPGAIQFGIPMVYQHERIGELRVTLRGPGDGFSPGDQELLESVARQTAVAAYAMRVSGDLQLARERLVTAREEERRRLRRDLHDGLGAPLAGLTIQSGVIKRLVRSKPVRAEAELDHLQEELRSAIADIRRFVHGLWPPALDEFGLVTALRSRLLAFESKGDGFSTELVATGDDHTLPAAVEVAIYRITEEALTNISRHAAARSATVVLDIALAVRLEITDDGRGIAPESRVGVGVQSMRERTEELGGTYEIGTRDSAGTRIVVTIPLPNPDIA
jgi:signal transduction histidine kinase